MAVTKRILPDAETILDLKTTLASKTMYKDAPNLYACLSEAFETDQFRGNTAIQPQALHTSITIPVEAHVRSELIYALGQQGFRHPYGPNHVVAMLTGTGTPHYKWRADTFKRVAETGPRLANVVGKGRLSLADFLPEV